MYGLFEKGSEEIATKLEAQPYRDKAYYLDNYRTTYQLLDHPMTGLQEEFLPKLLSLSEHLDHFYFLQKLQLNCVLESAKNFFKVEQDLPFFEEIQNEIKERSLTDTPTLYLYTLTNHLFQNPNSDAIFNKLYQQFLIHRHQLSDNDQETILKYLINHTTHQLNKGNGEYVKKQFELYKMGLIGNLFTKGNLMTETTFSNITSAGAFLKEFQFVEQFIEGYQQFLNEEKRLEIVLLCSANLYFNKGNYAKTIELLSKVTFTRVIDKVRVKTLVELNT